LLENLSKPQISHEYQAQIVSFNGFNIPIVELVVESACAFAKFEFVEDVVVVHHVKHVVDVELEAVGLDEGVADQGLLVELAAEVVETLCSLQFLVVFVTQDAAAQLLEGEEVRDLPVFDHDLTVHDVFLPDQQILDFGFGEVLLDHAAPTQIGHEVLIKVVLGEVGLSKRHELTHEVFVAQTEFLDLVFHLAVAQRTEANLDQLLRVEVAVPLLALGDRLGDLVADGLYGLLDS